MKVSRSLLNWFRRTRGPLAEVFTEIYRQNSWASDESRSGPGSTLERTVIIRRELPAVLEELKVRALLDAPCGDLNWMARVELRVERYVGVDIVEELIAANRARYGSSKRRFQVADVVRDRLPKCDAVLCRDCFIHLPISDIRRAIENFKGSGATYLLATTHTGVTENVEIPAGAWRSINLEKPPFALPPPIHRIVENANTSKSLGVWRLPEIA